MLVRSLLSLLFLFSGDSFLVGLCFFFCCFCGSLSLITQSVDSGIKFLCCRFTTLSITDRHVVLSKSDSLDFVIGENADQSGHYDVFH